jgi:Lrp/AsnC family transcriptional regulator, cysteine-sensing transcriptional activator
MDEVDRKILRVLQSDSELSIEALADRVGLSHTPCWRRLKRLEQDGIVATRTLVVDQDGIGLPITVFANLKLKMHDETTLEALEKSLLDCAHIVECFSIAGSSDYVCRIVVESIAAYEIFLKKTLLHLPGVSEVNSQVALKRVKLTTKLPV